MQKYMNKKKKNFHIAMYKAKRSKTCYLFLILDKPWIYTGI